MVDFPGRPLNEVEKQKIRTKLSDPICVFLLECGVQAMNELSRQQKDGTLEINFWETDYRNLRLLLRRFIERFGLYQMQELVYQIHIELADGYWENFIPPEINEDVKETSIDPTAQELSGKIKITDIAKKYGLKIKGNMAICPFHEDHNPSLSFNNEKGVFFCFGCKARGDIITFVRLIEDLKK